MKIRATERHSLLEDWRNKYYQQKQENIAKVQGEIKAVLDQHPYGYSWEAILDQLYEECLVQAGEAGPSPSYYRNYAHGDGDIDYDDGSEEFVFNVDLESKETNVWIECSGVGIATAKQGMKSGNYYVPDDPDEVHFHLRTATLEIYDGEQCLGTWDIAEILNDIDNY